MAEDPRDEHWSRTERLVEHIGSESSLEVLLRGHLWIEQELAAAVRSALPVPDALEDGGILPFALRLRLVTALGLMPRREVGAYRAINSLRNKIAHSPDADITRQNVDDLVNALGPVARRVYDRYLGEQTDEAVDPDDWLEHLRMLISVLFMCVEGWRSRLSEFPDDVREFLARYDGDVEQHSETI